jgi:hypothetical protein
MISGYFNHTTMQKHNTTKLRLFGAFLFLGGCMLSHGQLTTVQIAGNNGAGSLYFSNVKNWATEPDPVTQSPFPYYFDTGSGLWTTIVSVPLSSTTTYVQESSFTVLNKTNTQSDFATMSAGVLQYDASLISGSGIEVIGVGNFTMDLNTLSYQNPMPAPSQWKGGTAGMISPFSPIYSQFNTGSGVGNYGWSYIITPSNFAGTGLTFTDGNLTAIDFTADISVVVRFANDSGVGQFANPYNGSVSFAGNGYQFHLDVTQNNSNFLSTFTNTRMVFDRSGTVASVIPEPSSALLVSLAGIAALMRRRWLAAKQ